MKKKAKETPENETPPEIAMPEIAVPEPAHEIEVPALGGEEQPELPPPEHEDGEGVESTHADDDGEQPERLDGKALTKKLHSVP